ncbi:hypothetical protein HY546_01685, partial [archaeon]|nr:hypothetical protein [archaeon]
MNRKIGVRLLLLILVMLVIPAYKAPSYEVCSSGCNYIWIQNAINNATTGDSIFIRPGTYNESVVLNVSYLNLTGNGTFNQIIINGSLIQDNAVLNVTANYANVSNITLVNGGWGLSVGGNRTSGGNYSSFNRIHIANITNQANGYITIGLIVGNMTENVTLSNITLNNISKRSNVTGNVYGAWLREYANGTNITDLNVTNVSAVQNANVWGVLVQNSRSLWRGNTTITNVSTTNTTEIASIYAGMRFDTTSATAGEKYAGANQTNFSADLNITLVSSCCLSRGLELTNGVMNVSFYNNVRITNVTSTGTTANGQALGLTIDQVGTEGNNFYGPVTVNNVSSPSDSRGISLGINGAVNTTNFSAQTMISNVSGGSTTYGAYILGANNRINGSLIIMNVSANLSGTGNGLAYGLRLDASSSSLPTIINFTRIEGVTANNNTDDTQGVYTTQNVYIASLFLGNITGSNGIGLNTIGGALTVNNFTTRGTITSTDVVIGTDNNATLGNGSMQSSANNSINFTADFAFGGAFNTTNVSLLRANISAAAAATDTYRGYWWGQVTVRDTATGAGVSGASVVFSNSSSANVGDRSTGSNGATDPILLLGVTISGGVRTNSDPYSISISRAGYGTTTTSLSLGSTEGGDVAAVSLSSGTGGGGVGGGGAGPGIDKDIIPRPPPSVLDGETGDVVVEVCVGLCLPPDLPLPPDTSIEVQLEVVAETRPGESAETGGLTEFACQLSVQPPRDRTVYAFVDTTRSTTNQTQCNWELRFNVPNDWLQLSETNSEDVTLMILEKNSWRQVHTELIKKDT